VIVLTVFFHLFSFIYSLQAIFNVPWSYRSTISDHLTHSNAIVSHSESTLNTHQFIALTVFS